jgi:hypothetical protein
VGIGSDENGLGGFIFDVVVTPVGLHEDGVDVGEVLISKLSSS